MRLILSLGRPSAKASDGAHKAAPAPKRPFMRLRRSIFPSGFRAVCPRLAFLPCGTNCAVEKSAAAFVILRLLTYCLLQAAPLKGAVSAKTAKKTGGWGRGNNKNQHLIGASSQGGHWI